MESTLGVFGSEDTNERLQLAPNTEAFRSFGFFNSNWTNFLRDLKSAKIYSNRIIEFFQWHLEHDNESSLEQSLTNYFNECKEKLNPNGSPTYAPTTLVSWFSIFERYWRFALDKELKTTNKGLYNNLKQWQKGYSSKQARSMTTDQLCEFLELSDTRHNLPQKVWAIVQYYTAERTECIKELNFSDVNKTISPFTNKIRYEIQFNPPKVPESLTTLITGELEIAILDRYIQRFENKTGPFFRYCKNDKLGNIQGTDSSIGINTLKNVWKEIAKALNLEEPNEYTGHCGRKTASIARAILAEQDNDSSDLTPNESERPNNSTSSTTLIPNQQNLFIVSASSSININISGISSSAPININISVGHSN